MAEHGLGAPKGPQHLPRLSAILTAAVDRLPANVVALSELLPAQIDGLSWQIDARAPKVRKIAGEDETARWLKTRPPGG